MWEGLSIFAAGFENSVEVNKAVIYTSVTGGYDTLMEPGAVDPEFDYVCFVERGRGTSERAGVWQIREIPYEGGSSRDISRFPKLNPHLVLPEYTFSVWIDGNVTIRDAGAYDLFREKMLRGVLYSGVRHGRRDCAYDEALACIDARKENFLTVLKTLRFLKEEGFPRHFGMYENNLIFRRHNAPEVIRFDSMWWDLYLRYVRRDQILHPYCMLKCGMPFDYLLPEDFSARNHSAFAYSKGHRVRTSRFPRILAMAVSRTVSLFI